MHQTPPPPIRKRQASFLRSHAIDIVTSKLIKLVWPTVLILLSGGCVNVTRLPVSLQIAVGTGAKSDVASRTNLQQLTNKIADEYMSLHPDVLLQLKFHPDSELVRNVESQSQLGAGPDLLITWVGTADSLERAGHLKPVAISRARLDPLRISDIEQFRDGATFRALPFLIQPNVACYDRRRLAKPPSDLSELKDQAYMGHRFGLPLELPELLWIASTFDADGPLLSLFRTNGEALSTWQGLAPGDRQRVEGWLNWLYQANLVSTIKFVDRATELVEGLRSGQFDWISCNSSSISYLQSKLGPHLGVSVLPGRQDGKPSRPIARLRVLSFGRDSSPAQQEKAADLALYLLNNYSQTDIVSKALGNLPVNKNAIVPAKGSPILSAIKSGRDHSTILNLHRGAGLTLSAEPIRHLLQRCVYGEVSPRDAAKSLEKVAQEIYARTVRKRPFLDTTLVRGRQ